ncbi:MAG: ATP-dependent Clp protease proteolytic subunit [Ruminococcus sp.]|nr:ATP-dependent Clp protease proteolytic subunit [Ruminococcus sp.]
MIVPNYITKKPNGTEKSVAPFDQLLSDRIILLFDEINDAVAASVIAQMHTLESADPKQDIQLYINSPGGSVTAGLAIYDVMRRLHCDVATVGCGLSASMGAFLLASGAKGKRCAYENSQIMLHQVLGSASGQATDVEIAARNLMKMRTRINQLLSSFTGMSVKKVEQICDRDYWMTAEEAKKAGVVDEVI